MKQSCACWRHGPCKKSTTCVRVVGILCFLLQLPVETRFRCFTAVREKEAKTGPGTILDVQRHKVRWLREIRFTGIQSYQSGLHELCGAVGSAGGVEAVILISPKLDDLELLLERDAGRLEMSVKSNFSCRRSLVRYEVSFSGCT